MIKKILKIVLYSVLGAAGICGIAIGSYYVWEHYFKRKVIDTKREWNQLPPKFKEFSEKNSLKIQLKSQEINVMNEKQIILTSGTAWSWYYENINDNLYDWYLMTNFHVVNDPIAYINNYSEYNSDKDEIVISNPSLLIEYYKKNVETQLPLDNYTFNLSYYLDDPINSMPEDWSKNYHELLSLETKYMDIIKGISIITDFQNDNVDLFSKNYLDSSINYQSYNLDMALIKISLDFSTNKELLQTYSEYSNVIEKYKSYKDDSINNGKFMPEDYLYIAGNPAKKSYAPTLSGKLFGVELEKNYILDYKDISINDSVLSMLKAPYYYTKDEYENFPLSGGASGSAVYKKYENINWEDTIPVGIYWGGLSATNNQFKPSVIPFIIDSKLSNLIDKTIKFNIFENFINWLVVKK